MLIAGVDDAGRGPVIGPLVVAGVLLRESQIPVLKSLGVRDSKSLSPKRREWLAGKIRKIAIDYALVEVSPAEIDTVVKMGKRLHKLNFLEAKAMAKVIERLKPDVAYVDASDVLAERFGSQVEEMVPFPVKIVSQHKADVLYPIVSASSILAKVRRDEIISKLSDLYGDIGSGYVTDPRTRRFLVSWFKEHGSWPDFVRKSWKPIAKIEAEVRRT